MRMFLILTFAILIAPVIVIVIIVFVVVFIIVRIKIFTKFPLPSFPLGITVVIV